MPNIKSAKKRMRQNEKVRARNKAYKARYKKLLKTVKKSHDREASLKLYPRIVSLLDRMALRRIVHPNKAARLKSRILKMIEKY